MTVTCLHPHDRESLVEVMGFGDGRVLYECPDCRNEFVIAEDVVTPVDQLVVRQALADEDHRGWDGTRQSGLWSNPYWGRLDG